MSSNDKDAEVFKFLSNFYLTWSYQLPKTFCIGEHINMNVDLLRKQATKKHASFYSYHYLSCLQ